MKKFSIILIVFLCFINVYANENKYFDITLPDTFEEEKDTNKTIYKWTSKDNSHNTLVITVANNNSKNNIINYTDKEIEEYKEYMQTEYDKALDEYNLHIDIKNIKKEKVNGLDALVYDVVWPTKESIGYDTYQKGITWTMKNNIYVYVWTDDKEINTEEETYKNILNSFKINDEIIKSNSIFNAQWKRILFVGTLAGITGYIISAIRKSKKH
jgi:hypothetical protein